MQKSIFLLLINFLWLGLFGQVEEVLDKHKHPPNFVLNLVDDAALQDFGSYGGEAYTTENLSAIISKNKN